MAETNELFPTDPDSLSLSLSLSLSVSLSKEILDKVLIRSGLYQD